MELVLAGMILVALVALAVFRPLVGADADEPVAHAHDGEREALEASKEAKYREIRDAELDFQMGKLSEPDFRATDRELRAQAIAILKRIDELDELEIGSEAAERR